MSRRGASGSRLERGAHPARSTTSPRPSDRAIESPGRFRSSWGSFNVAILYAGYRRAALLAEIPVSARARREVSVAPMLASIATPSGRPRCGGAASPPLLGARDELRERGSPKIGRFAKLDVAVHLAGALEQQGGIGEPRASHESELHTGLAQDQRADQVVVAGPMAVAADTVVFVDDFLRVGNLRDEEAPRRESQFAHRRGIPFEEFLQGWGLHGVPERLLVHALQE